MFVGFLNHSIISSAKAAVEADPFVTKDMKEAFGENVIKSYIKLKNLEIKNFKARNVFNKRKPVSQWEKDNTLDC